MDAWRVTHPLIREYSHKSNTSNSQYPSQARLDYALISERAMNKLIDIEIRDSHIHSLLDHKMIQVTMEIDFDRIQNRFGKTTELGIIHQEITEINKKKYNDELERDIVLQRIRDELKENVRRPTSKISEWNRILTNKLKKAAKHHLPRKTYFRGTNEYLSIKPGALNNKFKVNRTKAGKQLRELNKITAKLSNPNINLQTGDIETLKTIRTDWTQENILPHSDYLKIAQDLRQLIGNSIRHTRKLKLNAAIERRQQQYYIQQKNQLNSILERKIEWKGTDFLKHPSENRIITKPSEIKLLIKEYYESIMSPSLLPTHTLSHIELTEMQPRQDINPDISLLKPITEEELINTIKRLPHDKAPGPSKLSYEHIISSR
jgi:hypothetical protein